jgi:hypothetical protein
MCAVPDDASVKSHPDPPTEFEPNGECSVYKKIMSVIGVAPNRSELISFAEVLGCGPLTRAEKRVKSALIAKLESHRIAIHSFLETRQGKKALEDAYIALLHRARPSILQQEPSIAPRPLPPEATAEFYLNSH